MSIFQDVLKALNISTVGGKTLVSPLTGAQIAAQSATYASGDVIGTNNPIRMEVFTKEYGTGILQSIVLADLAAQNGIVNVVVFGQEPTATTFTDQSTLDVADADLAKIIYTGQIVAADYTSFVDNSAATKNAIGMPIKNNETASSTYKQHIWIVFVSADTKTYVANCLSANVGILQD